jgi:GNAT superfamily N-acetyltransferase
MIVLEQTTKAITYRLGGDLDAQAYLDLYRASTLGERRPIHDEPRMLEMLRQSNLVITAWDGELLVGISRNISDFAWTTYCCDLAVRRSHQRQGIGVELLRRTRDAAPQAKLLLLSAPAALGYYPHIGFTRLDNAFLLAPGDPLDERTSR